MKLLRLIAFSVFAFVLMLEFALHVADPLGVMTYRANLRVALKAMPYRTETVHFRGWSARMENGYRVTPDSNPDADCTIAFIGDSFTFGWGVDDHETYPNVLAQRFDIRAVNRGIHGYGIDEIVREWSQTEADGYVYLAVPGDEQKYPDLPRPVPLFSWSSALTYYRWRKTVQQVEPPAPAARQEYVQLVNVMRARPLVVGYFRMDAPTVHAVHVWYDYTLKVSAADGHYNAAGNAYVADTLEGAVSEMIGGAC